ncbi:MAG TPA: hypothetical protein VNL96_05825 [Gemmatimonadaceae bacterium]|nr:hypothetical protein [Gemmatimonadaceae bacterium]
MLQAAVDPDGVMARTGITSMSLVQLAGVMVMLSSGFILTAMLWGAALAYLLDGRFRAALLTLGACGLLALFGFIHSVRPEGGIYLPWRSGSQLPYHWLAAYWSAALLVYTLGRRSRRAAGRAMV